MFACIVAGVTGDYIHKSHASSMSLWRFIYTVTVSAISILLTLLWQIPFSSTFVHWHIDFFISVLWWISFGILVNVSCGLPSSLVIGLPFAHFYTSSLETTVVPYSTGAMSTLEETSAASSRPPLPLRSYRQFFGWHPRWLACSGCARGRSESSRSTAAIDAGTAATFNLFRGYKSYYMADELVKLGEEIPLMILRLRRCNCMWLFEIFFSV